MRVVLIPSNAKLWISLHITHNPNRGIWFIICCICQAYALVILAEVDHFFHHIFINLIIQPCTLNYKVEITFIFRNEWALPLVRLCHCWTPRIHWTYQHNVESLSDLHYFEVYAFSNEGEIAVNLKTTIFQIYSCLILYHAFFDILSSFSLLMSSPR